MYGFKSLLLLLRVSQLGQLLFLLPPLSWNDPTTCNPRTDRSKPSSKYSSAGEAVGLRATVGAKRPTLSVWCSLDWRFLECEAIACTSLSPVPCTEPHVLNEWKRPCDEKVSSRKVEATPVASSSQVSQLSEQRLTSEWSGYFTLFLKKLAKLRILSTFY